MGWTGIAIGGYVGSLFGGALGAIFGAVIGNGIEKAVRGDDKQKRAPGGRRTSSAGSRQRSAIFCATAAAMLAKMAKADGHVSKVEIASVESAFARLGFTAETRRYAVEVFRKAKDDRHTIFEYASEFASAVDSVAVRELFYELLWDLACSDGMVSGEELGYLRGLPQALAIDPRWFHLFSSDRLGTDNAGGGRGRRPEPPPRDELKEAYAILGVEASADDAEVKRAYREKAKKYHPDTLRAQGLPDEMIGKATEMMAKVNAAWTLIRESREK